jgi:hypothetical protein
MTPPLARYLSDHLAGAASAISLLTSMVRRHRRLVPGETLRQLLLDIRADQRALKALARAVGVGWSPKTLLGSIGAVAVRARTSRLAVRSERFALFEGLEVLVVGIAGKRCLWRALHTVDHPAVRRLDLLALERRAEDQLTRADRLRVSMAPGALMPRPEPALERGVTPRRRGRV